MLYELRVEDNEAINCKDCAQDVLRVWLQADTPEEARQKFRLGEGLCSVCWVAAQAFEALLVSIEDVEAYDVAGGTQ